MFTNKRQAGFTILEVTIALGLMGIGALALMTTSEYFLKSKVANESRAAHTDLRNLVQQALAQKTKVCPGGSTACSVVNNCRASLRSKTGGPVPIPTAKIQSHDNLDASDNLELAVYMGSPRPTLVIQSGNVASTTNARERADKQRYKVVLVGRYKSETPTTITYAGAIEITADRILQGRPDVLRASVPLDFTMDRITNAFEDCTTRPTERVIAGGDNTVNGCQTAGGTPVPTSIGMLCRFKTPPILSVPPVTCPPGFVGDPKVACMLDKSADSPLIDSIPACPAVAAPASRCLDGFYLSTASIGNISPCVACATPAVLNGIGVVYTSAGTRTAATDCAVQSVAACNAPYAKVGTRCLPPGCTLNASISTFSSPTGLNLKGGSIRVSYSGQSSTAAITATISSPTGTAGIVSQVSGSSYTFSSLPQGDYTIVVNDPNPLLGAGCSATLQKTLRVGGFFPDPVMAKGSLYCNYQGYPGGIAAPECPLDPVDPADLSDPDYVPPNPPSGWSEISYSPTTNLRKCKYPFECKSPDIIRVDAPPVGDGQTPSCYRSITECPNTDPPTYPGPWLKIASSPLKCKLNTNVAPPSPVPARCPVGFQPVLNTSPGVKEWAPTSGLFGLISPYVLCH